MTLRPTSHAWLLSRNLLAKTQRGGSLVSTLGVKYLRVVMSRKPRHIPADIQAWVLSQPLLMPQVPGIQ